MCKRRDRSSCAGQCGGQQGLDASGASRQAVEADEAITGQAETCPPRCRVEAFGVMLLLDIEFYLDTGCMRMGRHLCSPGGGRAHLGFGERPPVRVFERLPRGNPRPTARSRPTPAQGALGDGHSGLAF